MLNREIGLKPMRSRRCMDERTSIMSLDLRIWEGEVSNESEPEELPENKP